MSQRVAIHWWDAQQSYCHTFLEQDSHNDAVASAIAALSTASVLNMTIADLDLPASSNPLTDERPSLKYKAITVFNTAIGSDKGMLHIPAPVDDIMNGSYEELVNPASMGGLLAAAAGNLLGPGGQAVVSFAFGLLVLNNYQFLGIATNTAFTQRTYLWWLDVYGARCFTWYDSQAVDDAIKPVLTGSSNAIVTQTMRAHVQVNPFAFSNSGTFTSIYDQAELIFEDSKNTRSRIIIPAPVDSVFLSDLATVDPAGVAAVITQALIHCRSRGGNPLQRFLSGRRINIAPGRAVEQTI